MFLGFGLKVMPGYMISGVEKRIGKYYWYSKDTYLCGSEPTVLLIYKQSSHNSADKSLEENVGIAATLNTSIFFGLNKDSVEIKFQRKQNC